MKQLPDADDNAPLADRNGHMEPELAPERRLSCSGEVRLLVIDDEVPICELIRTILKHEDFVIDTLSDPRQLNDHLRKTAGTYHIVILDYVLPGLDSEQVLTWVRDTQPEASIIVVTGYPSMNSALHCLRARSHDYLTKPFQVEQLHRIVMHCLESRGQLRLSEQALQRALGQVIRDRRKALGLTLAELARRTGVSLGYLSQIELGKNSASIETLYRVALGLRVRLADLFQSIQPVL